MGTGVARTVIVVGLDGVDPRLVEPLLASGSLPNLARLRAEGGYAPLQTTHPAQTPVAWSTFATGANPGRHGIFDFIRRDPLTYLPDLSLTRFERKAAYLPPRAVNLRRGTPVWEILSAAGVPSCILRCPCTFPPDDIRGRMLSGMGVPDLRGGLGTATLYTSQPGIKAEDNEHVLHVVSDADGAIRTRLIGPRNPASQGDFTADLVFQPEVARRSVTIRSDGQPKAVEVREGQWSEWLRVRFKTGLLQSISGVVRFILLRLEPVFELYASPVNFDPEAPMFPISAPAAYARELARQVGTFYTTGMVEDHGGLNNGRFDEAAFLAQCDGVLRERSAMMRFELDRVREGLLFCLFDTPDRVQHMFWRFRDRPPEGGDGSALARAIDEHYRACDRIIGEALGRADDRTLVIVLSDHGVGDFRRGVHLNTWLHDQGLLRLAAGVRPGEDAGDLLRRVDWERTRAYALGLTGIYLNLKGRESRGIVGPGEVPTLGRSIATALGAVRDPENDGRPPIRRVLSREQLYAGPYADESPDLVVNFANGYRVSWGTALGAVPVGHFEDNVKKWSGDHLMDPSLVPGVLFMNRPFRGEGAGLVDLAPTILAALGVPSGPDMEGRSLLG
jgi:predicted AlkP superfamily phosphohydrolase/phosphomutase